MKSDHNTYNRRNFIRTAGCAALGSTSFFSTLLNLQAMSNCSFVNSFNSDDDYKALVCIMLAGGNDSFNTVIPYDTANYNEYQFSRSELAIPHDELLPIYPDNYNEMELAFHPSAPEMQELFEDGKLAIVCNVGTLVQPTSRLNYESAFNIPTGLFSHSDQAHHWQTSVPQTSYATGWGGRLSDMVRSANSNSEISMNISLSGKNVFQSGLESSEYSILPIADGSVGINGYNGNSSYDQLKTGLVKSLMEKQYQDIFKRSYADVVRASQNAHELFSGAVSNSIIQTDFSDSNLSQSLKMIARTIKVRESLGMKRQCFFVRVEGWDHHRDLLDNHKDLLRELSISLKEFQESLEELEIEDSVCSFTISDFGRTLNSNGSGSDHAWGSIMFAMGSQVKGREIYGSYPELNLASNIMLDGGILIPQISTDEYFAELALWYGVSQTDLVDLFPNIGNFYNAMSGSAPVGFMNI